MAQKVLNGTGLKVNKKKPTHWWLICLLLAYCYLQSKNPDLVDPVIFFSLHFTLVVQGHLTRHLLRIHLLKGIGFFFCVSEIKMAFFFFFSHKRSWVCLYTISHWAYVSLRPPETKQRSIWPQFIAWQLSSRYRSHSCFTSNPLFYPSSRWKTKKCLSLACTFI